MIPEPVIPEYIGPYRVDGLLGRGGMGEVYQAYDEKLERRVAIKLIRASEVRAETLKHFLREARTAARLSHPAIVQIYHVEEVAGDDCIVMELIDGRPLSTWIESGPLAPADAVVVARQIVEGLAEAHAKSIVHRDLKTENVMVTPEGRAKILDFGLAKPIPSIQTDSQSDQLIGTPRAMSPEQANEMPVDGKSDLFSLGSLLYELTTGKAPFRGRTPLAVLHQVCYHRPPPACELNPEVPQELSTLIGRLMEKRPEDRPRSALEVRDALTAIEAALVGQGTRPWGRPQVIHDERRQVTMLCCGLGVERLGARKDPSILGSSFLNQAAALVQRHVGNVVKSTPGELVACFGHPRAYGDDACRAVRSALAILSLYRSRLADRDSKLRLWLAIHTGVAELRGRGAGSSGAAALGETAEPWKEAARLLAECEPGSVWVSRATRSLVEATFECDEPLGGPDGKVCRVRGWVDRRGAALPGDLTTLVARREELRLMEERWELAREGRGQVVLVSGDVGVGKTRLLGALGARLDLGPADTWSSRCSAQLQASAFRPAVALLWQILGTDRGAPPAVVRSRLEELAAGFGLEDHLPVWAALLGLDLLGLDPAPAQPFDPLERRERIIASILELLIALAAERPRIWVVEDLHWSDPSTLELLDRLIDQVPTSRLLLLISFRSRLHAPWNARSYVTPLVLNGLSSRDSKELIRMRSGQARLPVELVEQIAGLSDGVPLFIEGLTRLAVDSAPGLGAGAAADVRDALERLPIPSTLRDALMARLDRLGTSKQLAQMVAVFGRDFPYDLLEAVSPFDKETLGRDLERLVEAELLYRQGVSKVKYHFRHALIRQAAYESLAEEERRRYHSVIARALEDRFSDMVRLHPELLAHHYAAAGEMNHAARWLRAGRRSF